MNGVKWDTSAFMARLAQARDAAAMAAAAELADTIRASMPGLQLGAASKPGAFPNRQKGHLANSMAWERGKDGIAYAGSALPYARWLNNGTTKIAARPWARLGVAKARQTMQALANAAMRKSLGGG